MPASAPAFPWLEDPRLAVPLAPPVLRGLRVDVPRHFSHGAWPARWHAVIELRAADQSGWGEAICAYDDIPAAFPAWANAFAELNGLTVAQAFTHVRDAADRWPEGKREATEIALLDLIARLRHEPLATLLGWSHSAPVPALFCILERDPALLLERAALARSRHLDSHLKLKLFAEPDLDLLLVRQLRAFTGPASFILGDANGGYPDDASLPDQLRRLHAAGLDQLEDPASLTPERWAALQTAVHPLGLVADTLLRPARAGLGRLLPGLAAVVNLHPGCQGSALDAVAVAAAARPLGLGVMVGDDSLIGPGCAFWQHLAIGLGASCVEAIEKPQESDAFTSAITHPATRFGSDGRCHLDHRLPGTGLLVDTARLDARADLRLLLA